MSDIGSTWSFPPDPQVALRPPQVAPLVPGPAHQVQFVVELVGPRTVPAQSAKRLLDQDWYSALGEPELFCMSGADTEWARLNARSDGSYDSLALAWDIIAPRGVLLPKSADHLFQFSNQFAAAINRKAVSIPTPNELGAIAKRLQQLQRGLDIGVSVSVFPAGDSCSELAIWQICSRLGLQVSPSGTFEFRAAQHPVALFSVTPLDEGAQFSLAGAQAPAKHEGVVLGFNMPTCPSPLEAVDAMLYAGDLLAQELRGAVFEDTGDLMTLDKRAKLRQDVVTGVNVLRQAKIECGSAAALKLFGGGS